MRPPERPHWRTYVLDKRVIVSGSSPTQASVVTGEEDSKVQVQVRLDRAARAIFAEVTKAHRGERIAIVLDEEVTSTPRIMERIDDGVVPVFVSERSGREPQSDAEDLATSLRHPLPAPIRIDSETLIGR